jgi:hypothetical protein
MADAAAAVNKPTGHPPSGSFYSGSSEAFVRQGQIPLPEPVRQHLRYGTVVTAAYPFSDWWAKPVELSGWLAGRTERVINLHTSFGYWSNPLGGGRVENVRVTLGQKAIPHGEFDEVYAYRGAERLINPVLLVAAAAVNPRAKAGEVRETAQLLAEGRGLERLSSWAGYWNAGGSGGSGIRAHGVAPESFRCIPLTALGQDKVGDVYHWHAEDLSPRRVAADTLSFLNQHSLTKVTLRTDDPDRANEVAQQLKRGGAEVTVLPSSAEVSRWAKELKQGAQKGFSDWARDTVASAVSEGLITPHLPDWASKVKSAYDRADSAREWWQWAHELQRPAQSPNEALDRLTPIAGLGGPMTSDFA